LLDAHMAHRAGTGQPTVQHHAVRMNLSGDESFAFGLDCLLDGIAMRIASAGGHPPARPE
jgi:hypothetical protein